MTEIIRPGTSSLTRAIQAERDRRARLVAMQEQAEDDLVAFVRMMWHAVEPVEQFVPGWPMEAVADALMAVHDGEITRLIVNVFPGAMKSLLLNVFFPAWEWGPRGKSHLRYISTSYSADLTERDNGRLLRVLTDPVFRQCWPGLRLVREGTKMVETDQTGWKLATSVGGKMTGFRGNRILIDDANNPNEVDSERVRAGTNLWLREVMPDRLSSLHRDAIINVQQRTHEEDATGTLAKFGVGYSWMCIPMEYDPLRSFPVVLKRSEDGAPDEVWVDPRGLDDDGNELEGLITNDRGIQQIRTGSPMAAAEGALAWPSRFTPASVDALRKEKGGYGYACQYQQTPGTRGGETLRRDWWQLWPNRKFPDFGTVVLSLDTAFEDNTKADWNALVGLGAFPSDTGAPQIMLRFAERKKGALADIVKWVYDQSIATKADYLLIEHKSRGRDVHDEIKRQFRNVPFQVLLVKLQGDKMSRANAVAPLLSGDMRRDPETGLEVYTGGMVWAPDVLWADEVISECSSFPNGAHDDYVDALTQGLAWMRRNGVVLRRVEHDAMQEDALKFRKQPSIPYRIE